MRNFSWPTKKLVEVCESIKSGIAIFEGEKEYIDTNSVQNFSIVKSQGITYKKRPSRANMEAKANDVLVAKMADTLKVYLVTPKDEKKRIFSTGFLVLRPKKDLIEPKYLFLYCSSNLFQKVRDYFAHGSTQKAINDEHLKKYFQISLPPLKTQKRIVARIEELFEKIDKTKGLRQKAQEQTAIILPAALEQIFRRVEKKAWAIKKIKEVCEIATGSTPSTKNSKYWNGEILWATPKDLGRLKTIEIFDTERKITKEGLNSCSARLLPKGTVLLTTRAPIGHIAIAEKEMATNQGFKSFICSEKIYNRFLYYGLKYFVPQLQWLGRGATFPEISKTIVEKFEIPLPPLPEQKKIVAYLDNLRGQVEKLKQIQQNQSEELTELKQSILDKAFKGEITYNQIK